MIPIISVVGLKNSGKTTLIERLIPALKSRGLRVATLKHDVHGFEMDHEGKDTFRFARAGADVVGIACQDKVAHIELVEREVSPEEFLRKLSCPPDILLVEGFKRRPFPKIEVVDTPSPPAKQAPTLPSTTSGGGSRPLLLATFSRESTAVGTYSKRPHFTEVKKLADFLLGLYFERTRTLAAVPGAPRSGASAAEGQAISAFIIAGGKSERLGQDKACVLLTGEPLIQWVFRSVRPFFGRVFIVTRTPRVFHFLKEQGAEILPDLLPEVHSLGGLYSALSQSGTEYSFICPCDTPFLQPLLLKELRAASSGYDATVCRINGQIEPLCGIYHKKCISPIEEMLKTGNLRIQDLFSRIRARFLSELEVDELNPEGFSFFDVDTQQDLDKAEKMLL